MPTKTITLAALFALSAVACGLPTDPSDTASGTPEILLDDATGTDPDGTVGVLGIPALLDPAQCSLEAQAVLFAGPDARDCGFVALDDPSEAADAARWCAAEAFASGEPFHVAYALAGYEGEVIEQLSGDADGRLYDTRYDESPCGGGDCGPSYLTWRCDAPLIAANGSFGCDEWLPIVRLQCE